MGVFAGSVLKGMVAALAIYGFAIGLFLPPNMSLILGSGSREGEGVASSVMMTLRNVGAVLGVAILGTIAVQVILMVMGGHYVQAPTPAQLAPGFHEAFLAGVVICIIVAVISVFISEKRESSGAGE